MRATDIHAVVVYGSRALPTSQSDRYSDLDLVLLTSRPNKFAENSDWLEDIGEIWLAVLDITGARDLEWFVLYHSGLKVDIILAQATPTASISSLIDSSPYSEALLEGYRVLYQGSGNFRSREMKAAAKTQPVRILESDITQDIDLALMRIVKATMLFCRGDLERCRFVPYGSVYRQLISIVHSIETLRRYVASRDEHLYIGGAELMLSTFEQLFIFHEDGDREHLRRALAYAIDLVSLMTEDLSAERGLHLPDIGQEKTITWLQKLLGASGSFQVGVSRPHISSTCASLPFLIPAKAGLR